MSPLNRSYIPLGLIPILSKFLGSDLVINSSFINYLKFRNFLQISNLLIWDQIFILFDFNIKLIWIKFLIRALVHWATFRYCLALGTKILRHQLHLSLLRPFGLIYQNYHQSSMIRISLLRLTTNLVILRKLMLVHMIS